MRHLKRLLIAASSVIVMASAAFAQANNAQVCVRLFEDRSASGTLDAGEPFITKDVGVNLANDQGVIIKTALVDDSAQASSGLVCFTQLEAGQYTVSVVSAAYAPTTESVFVTAVGASAVPLVFDVGMERITTSVATVAATDGTLTPSQARYALERVFVAGIGSLLAVVVFTAIGALLYVLLLRPRAQAKPVYAPSPYVRPDSGVYNRPPGTGSMPVIPATPVVSEPLPPIEESYDEDTGSYRPV